MRDPLLDGLAGRRRVMAWVAGTTALAAGHGVARGAGQSSATGAAMPALDLAASDGLPVLPGEPTPWRLTYIDFWASWCTPCRLAFPWLNDMHERFGPQGLRIVGVCLDRRRDDALRFLERWPARFAIAMDPQADAARRLDVKVMPSSFAVDAGRRLRFSHQGFRTEDRPELEKRLLAALA